VTTVPAAGVMALSLALTDGGAFTQAATQLGVNLSGILVAAILTLTVQRALWRRVRGAVPRSRPPGGGSARR
jgi:hypothetical protein